MASRKKSIEEVKQKCLDNGIMFLDPEYHRNSFLHTVECLKCSHQWKIRFHDVGRYGCSVCSIEKIKEHSKKPFQDVTKMFAAKGLNFVDNYYVNSQYLHNAECQVCLYKWRVRYNAVQSGGGCPKCAGKLKPDVNKVQEVYSKVNAIFMDESYVNNSHPHNVVCSKCSWKWNLRYQDAKKGHGCPRCGLSLKFSLKDVQEKLLEKNFIFLDVFYSNKNALHKMQCLKCNNVLMKSVGGILNSDSGCPFCSSGKNEKRCIKYIENLLKIKINKKTIFMNQDFQKKCSVDSFFTLGDKTIIVEYNGDQHFRPINFCGDKNKAQQRFEKQVKRDFWLREYCKKNNIILIEIDGRYYKNSDIEKKLMEEFRQYQLLKDI